MLKTSPSRSMRRLALALVPAITAVLGAGCRPSTPPETAETAMNRDLDNVGELYRIASINKGRPPKDLNELKQAEGGLAGGLTQLNADNLVIFWGAELADLGEEPGRVKSDKVLAYEKQVPEQGGSVLMLDRTVKKVTADEFKSMPKAGTEPPADAGK